MDLNSILYPALTLGGMSVVFGAVLGFASIKFEVKQDEKVVRIREALPGANCGGCGFVGCDAFAEAAASGKAKPNGCPVGAAAAATKIAAILGVEAQIAEPKTAFIKCGGTCEKSINKYEYFGLQDCKAAMQLTGGGAKGCTFGCLGLGSCVNVCQFGAISITDGIAKVDKVKCTECGACVASCPKKLIELIPKRSVVTVACNSKDNGKTVRANCSVGCIGCKRCEKACQFDAIHTVDNVSSIDYKKCTNCGECAKVCPTRCIVM